MTRIHGDALPGQDLHGKVVLVRADAIRSGNEGHLVAIHKDRRFLVVFGHGARPHGTGRACYGHWLAVPGLGADRVDREEIHSLDPSQWVPEWLADHQAKAIAEALA